MDLPVKFPDERDKIYREVLAFRILSPEERTHAMLDVIALGESMIEESPHREVILRQLQLQEDEWKKAQKDLFAKLGV